MLEKRKAQKDARLAKIRQRKLKQQQEVGSEEGDGEAKLELTDFDFTGTEKTRSSDGE